MEKKIALTITNISKEYHDDKKIVRALNNVSLDIYQGEILSLLGVNGAGKTTLSSILATLHPPTSGDIRYKKESIYDQLIAYRSQLGFCPQKINLDSDLNVADNLYFACRYFLMTKQEALLRTVELLEKFNLEKYAQFDVDELSGGYQRRLLIARSLVHQPSILILDEPTVGLDPHIRHNLWDIIKELREQNITVILTTHYLDEAELLSDRVCLLSQGKVVFVGPTKELKKVHKKETLEEVFLEFSKEPEEEPINE